MSGALRFPLNFDAGRPLVSFKVKGEDAQIFLPIPAGLTFGDGGNYSSIDLGTIGNITQALDFSSFSDFGSSLKNQFSTSKGSDVASIVGAMAAGGGIGQTAQKAAFLAGNRSILNPNTNTTFESNSIRTFPFSFTMVARSEKEAQTIRDIHNTLRKYAYPKSSLDAANVILDYPPIWNITFEHSPYLPKIYDCYLTDLSTTFNPSANMYHTDMAPAEVSVTITFQETRALIRSDIEALAAG